MTRYKAGVEASKCSAIAVTFEGMMSRSPDVFAVWTALVVLAGSAIFAAAFTYLAIMGPEDG